MMMSELLLLFAGLALAAGAWFFRQLDRRISELSKAVFKLSSDLSIMKVRNEDLVDLKVEFAKYTQKVIRLEEQVKNLGD